MFCFQTQKLKFGQQNEHGASQSEQDDRVHTVAHLVQVRRADEEAAHRAAARVQRPCAQDHRLLAAEEDRSPADQAAAAASRATTTTTTTTFAIAARQRSLQHYSADDYDTCQCRVDTEHYPIVNCFDGQQRDVELRRRRRGSKHGGCACGRSGERARPCAAHSRDVHAIACGERHVAGDGHRSSDCQANCALRRGEQTRLKSSDSSFFQSVTQQQANSYIQLLIRLLFSLLASRQQSAQGAHTADERAAEKEVRGAQRKQRRSPHRVSPRRHL